MMRQYQELYLQCIICLPIGEREDENGVFSWWREREAGLFNGGEQLVRDSVRIQNKVNRGCSVGQEIVRESTEQNRTEQKRVVLL